MFSEEIPKRDIVKYKTLEGMYVFSDLDTGNVDIRLDLSDEEKSLLEFSFIDLYIIYPDKKEIHITREASSIKENMLSFKIKVDPVIPWSPQNPNLYLAKAVFKSEKDGDLIAVASRRFGIRKIERRKDKFYFNRIPLGQYKVVVEVVPEEKKPDPKPQPDPPKDDEEPIEILPGWVGKNFLFMLETPVYASEAPEYTGPKKGSATITLFNNGISS